MYQYAYEFEWNRTYVYYYDWIAYDDSCLDVLVYLYFLKVWKACILV
jgi:hypothetical protein